MFQQVYIVKLFLILLIIKIGFITTVLSELLTSQQTNSDQGSLKNALWNATYTDMLKRDLLAHYDKFARPSHHTNITTVKIDLTFKHIDLDDTKFVMTVNGWIKMHWQDEKLKWNESEYGGLDRLQVADHEIWQPDVVIFESAVGSNIDQYGNIYLIVWSNGEVLWVPPCQFQVFCEMDLRKWPYDKHSCNLNFTSWTYAGDSINLTVTQSTTDHLNDGAYGWNIISIKAEQVVMFFTCCEEPYYKVVYTIALAREYLPYTIIVFAPAIAVIFLSLGVFWLPSNSSNKFVLRGITALIQAIFLIYLLQRLVMFGRNTPLIVVFYAYSIIFNGVSLIECLISYNMATNNYIKPLPRVIKNIITSKIFLLILFPIQQIWPRNQQNEKEPVGKSNLDEDRENLTYTRSYPKRSVKADGVVVATVLDRIMFYVSLGFYIGFIIKCLS